jgi:hypothetical protein
MMVIVKNVGKINCGRVLLLTKPWRLVSPDDRVYPLDFDHEETDVTIKVNDDSVEITGHDDEGNEWYCGEIKVNPIEPKDSCPGGMYFVRDLPSPELAIMVASEGKATNWDMIHLGNSNVHQDTYSSGLILTPSQLWSRLRMISKYRSRYYAMLLLWWGRPITI